MAKSRPLRWEWPSAPNSFSSTTDALTRLKQTNFHYRQQLFDDILKKYTDSGNG